jgi:hypothetical protein
MPPLNRLVDDDDDLEDNHVHWRRNQATNAFPEEAGRGIVSAPLNGTLTHTNSEVQDTPASERRARFCDHQNQTHSIRRGGREDGDDYSSEQEMVDCWYTASEFARFRQDIRTTVNLHKQDKCRIDGKKYTMRGIEHRVEPASSSNRVEPASSSNRRRGRRSSSSSSSRRSRARSAVMEEQAFQKDTGEPSADFIAVAYSYVTKDAVVGALNLAAKDQLDAVRYQENHETTTTSSLDEAPSFIYDWSIRTTSTTTDVDSSSSSSGVETHEAVMNVSEELSDFNDSWLSGN